MCNKATIAVYLSCTGSYKEHVFIFAEAMALRFWNAIKNTRSEQGERVF